MTNALLVSCLFLLLSAPLDAWALGQHFWAGLGGTATTCAAATSATRPNSPAGYIASVQAAIGCPGPGDTLTIMAGTYTGVTATITDTNQANRTRLQNGTAANPIIIEGDGAVGCAITNTCQTILKGMPNDFYFRSYVTFRRFEVDGSANVSIYGGQCFYLGSTPPVSDHIVFEDVHCHHAWGTGWAGVGTFIRWTRVRSEFNALTIGPTSCGETECTQEHGFYVAVDDSVIEDSYVNNNGKFPPQSGGYGIGIQIYSSASGDASDRAIVRRNTVVDNAGGGIAADGSGDLIIGNVVARNGGAGISLGYSPCQVSGGSILNNTVYGNATGLQIGLFAVCAHPVRTENNIVLENGGGQIEYFSGWTNSGDASSNITRGLIADYTVSTTDFHLKAGSTAIDTGVPAPEVTIDIDGVTRPLGTAIDLGAYLRGTWERHDPARRADGRHRPVIGGEHPK